MNIQFFSKYIDDYKNKIGKIVKVGKSSRGIDYDHERSYLMPKDKQLKAKWNAINKFFGLDDSDNTFGLFKQAATGLERQRITQLNSSSLFAFLFFHTVSRDNKVKVKINDHEDEFTNVAFEVSNTIDENTLPEEYGTKHRPVSHIDVVLSNERTILFLECKFSEYLEHYSSSDIDVSQRAYHTFYDKVFNVDVGGGVEDLEFIEVKNHKNIKSITIRKKDGGPCYSAGLAQTIAHFMGAHGILNSGRSHKDKDIRIEDKELYLAEVVFDFSYLASLSNDEKKKVDAALKSYAKFHKRLCEKLNTIKVAHEKERMITVHTDLLCYQRDFKLKLPSAFIDFYNLPETFR